MKSPKQTKGKKLSIEFDGIFRNSTVWVNGHLLGNHQSGYTPSNYDLTDVLRYGNEGQKCHFGEGGCYASPKAGGMKVAAFTGMCGLSKPIGCMLHRFGTYITTPVVSDAEATVSIKTTLKNEYKTAKNITLVSKIIDKKGVVLDTKTIYPVPLPF